MNEGEWLCDEGGEGNGAFLITTPQCCHLVLLLEMPVSHPSLNEFFL